MASGTVSTASGLGRFGGPFDFFGLESVMSTPDDLVPLPPQYVLDIVWRVVGMTLTHWALAEHSLSVTAAMIYKHLGGSKIEKQIPRSLSRTTKFLRKCFTRLPHLAAYKDDGEAILKVLEKHATVRHTLVHGAIKGYSHTRAMLYFERVNLDIPENIDVRETASVTLQQINDAATDVSALSATSLNFCSRLIREFVKK